MQVRYQAALRPVDDYYSSFFGADKRETVLIYSVFHWFIQRFNRECRLCVAALSYEGNGHSSLSRLALHDLGCVLGHVQSPDMGLLTRHFTYK